MQKNFHVSIEQSSRILYLFWIKMQNFIIEFSKKSKQQSQREEIKQQITKFKHEMKEIKSFMQQMQKMQTMQIKQRMQKMMKDSMKRQNARMKKKQLEKQRKQLKIMKTKKLIKTQSSSHQSSMHKAYFSSFQSHSHFAFRSRGNKFIILHSQQIFKLSKLTIYCFSFFWINYDCLLFCSSDLKLDDVKNVNTDSSSSNVYFKNNDLIFESNKKNYFFNSLWISVANSEVEYDSWIFLFADFSTDKWHLSKCFVFCKKIKDFMLDFFSFSIMSFSSINNTHIYFQNIEPHHSDEKKNKLQYRQFYFLFCLIVYCKMKLNEFYKNRFRNNHQHSKFFQAHNW